MKSKKLKHKLKDRIIRSMVREEKIAEQRKARSHKKAPLTDVQKKLRFEE